MERNQTTLPVAICDLELAEYLAASWKLFWEVSSCKEVVRGHCPIAYFGDVNAFRASQIRVITVGLNPSHREFGDKRGERFPGSVGANRNLTSEATWLDSVYGHDLNSYFEDARNPYRGWFDAAFKGVLSGLGASFYRSPSSALSRAIHTDLFSPIATDPTWSSLYRQNPALYERLVDEGTVLWQRLVELLQPDIIVASMQRDDVSRLGLNFSGEPEVLDCVAEKKGRTCAVVQTFTLASGRSGLLLTGGAGRKPMNGFGPQDRVLIGEAVRTRWLQMTS